MLVMRRLTGRGELRLGTYILNSRGHFFRRLAFFFFATSLDPRGLLIREQLKKLECADGGLTGHCHLCFAPTAAANAIRLRYV